MSSVLACAIPLDGHVAPMLAVCRSLTRAGHHVRFLTGAAYGDAVESAGGEHVQLPKTADITAEMLDAGRERDGTRLTGIRFAIDNTRRNFIATLPGWFDAIKREIGRGAAVITGDIGVFALGAVCARPRSERPAVIACGAIPVVLLSRDTAPPMTGLPPRSDLLGRTRNRVLNRIVAHGIFRGLQREADAAARRHTGASLPVFLTDWPRAADAYVQFSVPGFEYPRSDAPRSLTFVGPLRSPGVGTAPPAWWRDVEAAETVIHVSQGTLANRDFGELVHPTLRAFADDPRVLVVVATGGRPESDVGEVPSNARVARMLDYDRLMPHVDVFVTNGGYGSLHAALAHGVPIVAAGDTEEKVETCARVAWSGTGVDLRTGTPSSDRIRAAVLEVLSDPSYRSAARRIAADIRDAPGEAGLLEVVERVMATSRAA
jgi:UDP:flavonoid glycosyltransferase YjiC (YdhE family)